MIHLIEGARNSGKTFLVNSLDFNYKYKFDFVGWSGNLEIVEKKSEIHNFALAKEIMLHDLNKNGFIERVIVDRGILTVLVWGILNKRITETEAYYQLNKFIDKGLFEDTTILYVYGNNPEGRQKEDFWSDDIREKEREIYESILEIYEINTGNVTTFINDFTEASVKKFEEVFINTQLHSNFKFN